MLPLLRHAIFAICCPDPASSASSPSGSKNHRAALYCRQADSAAAGNILQQACNGLRRNAQFREREHLLAEVFQRGADVPDFRPVDYQD